MVFLRLVPVALLLLPVQSTRPTAAAAEIARQVQERYDHVADFSADFTHTYEGGVLKKTVTERGTLQIKKPGKMRWDYTSPEKKEFVSDGRQIYSYVPADKQVIVSPMPEEDQATTAILFLVGKGNVTRDFVVSLAEGNGPDTWALRLQPKQRQRDYDWLILEVDRQTMQIRALTAADQQGGKSTFRFSNYRENQHLADKIFAFTIPRGVDVIHSGQTPR